MGMEIIISVVLLLVGIAVLVIIHVCIVGRAFNRNNHSNGGLITVQRSMNYRSSSMSEDDIKNLPSFHYMVEEKLEKEKEINSSSSSPLEMEIVCAVCLENFEIGEKCRLLPKCKHCFHAECIDSWLLRTAICPICRTQPISPLIGGHDKNQIHVGVDLA